MSKVVKPLNFVDSARKLEVFKKSYSVSLDLHKITLTLPKSEQYDLASQIRRSSKSVCANIIEGFAKQSEYPKEFKRFLTTAIASAEETQLWLQYSLDLGYIDKDIFEKFYNEYLQTLKMLRSLRSKVKS